MTGRWGLSGSAALALLLGGCAISGLPAIGPAPATTGSIPAPPPPVVYGSFLDGPIGQKLSQVDRDKALAAEQDALASGQRRPWRGENGVYGYVEPSGAAAVAPVVTADGAAPPAAPAEACRGFTSTIYLSGRPQVGHGRGCANPDGTYHVTG